jgi:rare lipoprotein A
VFYQEGIASWYGAEFAGRPTASGEIFDPAGFTAAHPELPFGTVLSVVNVENGRRVFVRVNDRGPFVQARVIDVSMAAAAHLGIIEKGIARVSIELAPQGSATGIVGAGIYGDAIGGSVPAVPPVVTAPPAVAAPPAYPPQQPAVAQNPAVIAEGTLPANAVAAPQAPVPQTQPPVAAPAAPPPLVTEVIPQTAPTPITPAAPPPVAVTPPAAVSVPAQTGGASATVLGGPFVSGKFYRLQLGSYKVARNAVEVFDRLTAAGFSPQWEPHGELYRVVITKVPASDIAAFAVRLGNAGFKEVMAREER